MTINTVIPKVSDPEKEYKVEVVQTSEDFDPNVLERAKKYLDFLQCEIANFRNKI